MGSDVQVGICLRASDRMIDRRPSPRSTEAPLDSRRWAHGTVLPSRAVSRFGTRAPVVMPLESLSSTRDAHVVAFRIRITAENVNEPLPDSAHGVHQQARGQRGSRKISGTDCGPRQPTLTSPRGGPASGAENATPCASRVGWIPSRNKKSSGAWQKNSSTLGVTHARTSPVGHDVVAAAQDAKVRFAALSRLDSRSRLTV